MTTLPPSSFVFANRRKINGFTLIEMLIALLFMSLMMAGMLRVYASSTASFAMARDGITAQRANRWALGILEDDVQGAGLFYPALRQPPSGLSVVVGNQNPVMILPNQTLTYQSARPDGTLVSETLTFDEIQFLTDVPVPISAETAGALPIGSGSVPLTVTAGNLSDLQAGDLLFFLDQNSMDALNVASSSGSVVTAGPSTSGGVLATPGMIDVTSQGGFSTNASTQAAHVAQVPVMFLRPNMVVRYSLQAEALDPSNPAAMVPCLIREMAPYPASGALMNWASFGAATPGYTRERIMANASGLTVDMSLNGGQSWSRAAVAGAGTAGWGQIVTAANAQIAANPSPNNSINNALNPMWYRGIPALFRFDLQTRSSNVRAESSGTGTALAYKTRVQTLFVSPRNYTYGL